MNERGKKSFVLSGCFQFMSGCYSVLLVLNFPDRKLGTIHDSKILMPRSPRETVRSTVRVIHTVGMRTSDKATSPTKAIVPALVPRFLRSSIHDFMSTLYCDSARALDKAVTAFFNDPYGPSPWLIYRATPIMALSPPPLSGQRHGRGQRSVLQCGQVSRPGQLDFGVDRARPSEVVLRASRY